MPSPQAVGAVTKVLEAALLIPVHTPDLQLAMKREAWSRGLTLPMVAERMNLTEGYVRKRLVYGWQIHPSFLETFIVAVKVTPRVARRLRQLGAIAAGWNIELED
jgi:hypothetical protein